MALTQKQKKQLRRLGHDLHPVVRVAADGLKPTVLAAVEEALLAHELIKVSIRCEERATRQAWLAELCAASGAELVSRTGFTALLYRRHPERPRIRFDQT